MDTEQTLRRALDDAVAPIDGEPLEQMRARCRHVLRADYAARLAAQMGPERAARGARQASMLLAPTSPDAAQFLAEIALLLDPDTTKPPTPHAEGSTSIERPHQ